MNTQKIKFTANGITKEIEVQGCYPYLENSTTGKVVLVITAKEEDASAADLEVLKDNVSGEVEFYERTIDGELVGEWELKQVYTDYNSGEIRTSYQNGMREARVTRVDGIVKAQRQDRADIEYIAIMADIEL